MSISIDSKNLNNIIDIANKTKQIQSDIDSLEKSLKWTDDYLTSFADKIDEAKALSINTRKKELPAAIQVARVDLAESKKKFREAIGAAGTYVNGDDIYNAAVNDSNFNRGLMVQLQKDFTIPRRTAFYHSYPNQIGLIAFGVISALLCVTPVGIGLAIGGAIAMACFAAAFMIAMLVLYCVCGAISGTAKANQQRLEGFIEQGRGANKLSSTYANQLQPLQSTDLTSTTSLTPPVSTSSTVVTSDASLVTRTSSELTAANNVVGGFSRKNSK